jgi:hypothetical protein
VLRSCTFVSTLCGLVGGVSWWCEAARQTLQDFTRSTAAKWETINITPQRLTNRSLQFCVHVLAAIPSCAKHPALPVTLSDSLDNTSWNIPAGICGLVHTPLVRTNWSVRKLQQIPVIEKLNKCFQFQGVLRKPSTSVIEQLRCSWICVVADVGKSLVLF